MRRALQELEIVGPVTNVEFVKRVVEHEAFGGEAPDGLETGFIPKNKATLMKSETIPDKVYTQAALSQIVGPATPADAFGGFAGFANSWAYSQMRNFEFGGGMKTR